MAFSTSRRNGSWAISELRFGRRCTLIGPRHETTDLHHAETVSAISGTDTLPVGDQPTSFSWCETTATAYLAQLGDDTVSVIAITR